MDQINIIWKTYHAPEIIGRGYWDQAILEDLFARMPYQFNHVDDVDKLGQGEGPDQPGGIFIINGRTHIDDVPKINKDLGRLRWVVLIITGDEEALFPWQEIRHPMIRTWVQLPRMNVHNDVSFKLVNGYRTGSAELLQKIGYLPDRELDWFFAGQVNHARREQCVLELKNIALAFPRGVLRETTGFGQEAVSQKEYLELMRNAKIVPCPSGIETPDTFRLYEALEAGCVPVVDAFSTRHQAPGFWSYLFAENPPFPVVDYWDKFPALLPQLLKEYPANANKVSAWWQQHKRKIRYTLEDQIRELSK
jgi:hypothetical protein